MCSIRAFKKTTAILFLLWWSHLAFAFVAVPPVGRVVDQTQTLNEQQTLNLTKLLQQFEAKKGVQIAILIVETTSPETIDQYSLRVAEKWKLGRKKVDDGALLLVAMKDRTMRIEVGYGLEGVLNDAICKRIISEIMTPPFKEGKYYEGIYSGVTQMIKSLEGEPLPPPPHASDDLYNTFIFIIIASTIFASFVKPYFSQTKRRKVQASSFISTMAALLMFILTSSWYLSLGMILGAFVLSWLALSSQGSVGGGFGGGRGGSSGGGGGFSGGGGGFGGGGSSGKW